MQNYYGMAIRNNIGNLYAMKKAIGAILYHFTEIRDPYERHKFCPRDNNSWCKYWSKNDKNYTPKNKIPVYVKNLLLPIFKDLSDDELLKKCMHGKTQNANEALNGIIWSRIPKTTFVGRETVEMGVHSAVLHYNDGRRGVLKVLQHFALTGVVSEMAAIQLDKSRIKRMCKKSSDADKLRRQKLRSKKMGYTDNTKKNEPKDSYQSGGF